MVVSGLIKGPQEQCPDGAWTVATNGRETTNWGCYSNCAGGTSHCYSDCGWYYFLDFYHSWIMIWKYLLVGQFNNVALLFYSKCSTANSCMELPQRSCLEEHNCLWDGSSCNDKLGSQLFEHSQTYS